MGEDVDTCVFNQAYVDDKFVSMFLRGVWRRVMNRALWSVGESEHLFLRSLLLVLQSRGTASS